MSFADIAGLGLIAYVEQRRSAEEVWGFSHVPKTAGSSLVASLKNCREPYRNIEVRDYAADNDEFRRQEWQAVKEFVESQRAAPADVRCRSFSGHLRRAHIDFIRSNVDGIRVFTMLREPVARVVSDYRYCLTPAHPPHADFARRFPSLRDFVHHPMGQNQQAKYLAEKWQAGAEAVVDSVLNGFDFVGITELYEFSVSMIFRMGGMPHVSTEYRNRTVDTELNAIELDEALTQEIRELNALDDALYWMVRKLLEPHQAEWWQYFMALQEGDRA